MKLTNSEILSILNTIEEINDRDDLPARVSYALSKNGSKLSSEAQHVRQAEIDLLEKFGQKPEEENGQIVKTDEQGNILFKDDVDPQEFFEERMDLYNEEIEVEIHTIPIDYLDNVNISIQHISGIDPLIED